MESHVRQSIRWGIAFGLVAMVDYFIIALLPIPDRIAIIMAALFGPLLIIGSFALFRLLAVHQQTFSAEWAILFNSLAGALVTAMLLVQLAIHGTADKITPTLDRSLMREFDSIQLGLDVAWDVFIGLGTIAFGFAMQKHPRFGRIWGGIGILLGASLLILNLATFPAPPANAGLVDLGPLVGLWYAACSVRGLFSLRWLDNRLRSSAMSA